MKPETHKPRPLHEQVNIERIIQRIYKMCDEASVNSRVNDGSVKMKTK